MTVSALTANLPLTDYERGFLAALYLYAWHKDGELFVGTTGTTYASAAVRFLVERGYKVPA